jgi:hypothetical protein
LLILPSYGFEPTLPKGTLPVRHAQARIIYSIANLEAQLGIAEHKPLLAGDHL